jgi:putative ABC transport system permease protein
MLIISIGIMALVGILSAIDAIKNGINNNFTSMGANTFTIRNAEINIRVGRKGRKAKAYESITYQEALRFKKDFAYPVLTSVSTMASFNARIRYQDKKTNPNIQVFGSDENYIMTAGYELESGRNFNASEIKSGANLVILGKEIASAIFDKKTDPIDKIIKIGASRYKVIGVLKTKGNGAGFGGDKLCIIPLTNARQYFGKPGMSFTINVLTKNSQLLDILVNEAKGTFRKIRKIPLGRPEDFDVVKSDNLATLLIGNLKKVTAGATIIGLITLLGAAIGLMNIMLVSVTERTREIGIRKAMGATQKVIRNQFLIESVVICVLGGLFGILLGIVIGNLISFALETGFFVPWFWIISGVIICITVGLLSGYIPAKRASQLDPIESLRFE